MGSRSSCVSNETYEVASNHVPMLSNPNLVIDVIGTTANAVGGRSTAAGR
jgi:hypothetical protein